MEIAIAIFSLVVSLFTLWVTYLHKGRVEMTRPTIIAFAFEGYRRTEPKIFIRTLLYSTSKQIIVVESIFVKLIRQGSSQSFTVWAYGDKGLVRGSGISVTEQGVEVYHHFLIPESGSDFKFLQGKHTLEFYAVVKGKTKRIYELNLDLSEDMAERLDRQIISILFDWNPDRKTYLARIQNAGEIESTNLLD